MSKYTHRQSLPGRIHSPIICDLPVRSAGGRPQEFVLRAFLVLVVVGLMIAVGAWFCRGLDVSGVGGLIH